MSTSGDEPGPPPAKKLKRSYVACHRCHSHKIKCSGESPCRSCQNSNRAAECTFPVRDRKVVVPESYLKKLEAENKALKEEAAVRQLADQQAQQQQQQAQQVQQAIDRTASISSIAPPSFQSPLHTPDSDSGLDIPDNDGANPLFEDSTRYTRDKQSIKPVYIGEAACTAFGTRLRYYIKGNDMVSPPRRMDHFKHKGLLRIVNTEFQLPNRPYAKMLVKVVQRFVGSDYHFLTKKSFVARLEEVYRAQTHEDPVFLCRLFAVFALGELYSKPRASTTKGRSVPGTGYFLQAMSLFQDLHEEADIEYIETLLVLSFYSHALNRKNTAYTFAGLALRLSLTLGLHRNIQYPPETSKVEIENRRRVWWTVYTFDRLSSSKLGHPVMIRDEDIDAPLPSMEGLTPEEREDFPDPEQLVANVKISRICGTILNLLYSIPGAKQERYFVKDVHMILSRLKALDAELPQSLRLDHSKTPPFRTRSVASWGLTFNQCIILTTRPILLHVFKIHIRPAMSVEPPKSPRYLSPMTTALAEACVQAARASNKLLAQLWIDGSIATFGYFDAHYIFSSTIVLLMSNVLKPNDADKEAIDTAWDLLRSMASDGNLPATEYCDRLAMLQKDLEESYLACPHTPAAAAASQALGAIPMTATAPPGPSADVAGALPMLTQPTDPSLNPLAWDEYSTICAPLDDPFIQSFLMQPDPEWSPGTLGLMGDSTVPWAFNWEAGDFMGEIGES